MKKGVLFLIILFTLSCKSTIALDGKTFELSDSEELIRIQFISNDICEVQQSFYCDNIPDSLKMTSIKAKYKITKTKLPYFKGNKSKFLKVKFLTISNLDASSKQLPKYTYIDNYSKMCQNSVPENSNEMKLRNKVPSGIILNLTNDSLILKKDTIVFGYKKVAVKK
ncbi:MAG: hypothetical protein ACOVRN_08425 [Flavobacterium sp.]